MNTQATIFAAFLIGLIAGVSPGPLTALIIAETVKNGKASGIKIAMAPLITDLPILLVSIFILSKLEHFNILLGMISLVGACYVLYLAYENITIKNMPISLQIDSNESLVKGVVTNFLNPGPYLFFFTIGGPIVIKAMRVNYFNGPIFIIIFLSIFVAINVLLAMFVNVSKSLFRSNKYVYLIKALGILLVFFSLLLFKESFQFFGVMR